MYKTCTTSRGFALLVIYYYSSLNDRDDYNFTELFHVQYLVELKALCHILRDCPLWATDALIPLHVGYNLYREVLLY